MHVAVVGAGALGRAFGVRLAAAGHEVTFVVRASRVAETEPFRLEQINGPKRQDVLDAPRRTDTVPPGTEAAIVTVRFDQLATPELAAVLKRTPAGAPIVVLTPLLPAQKADLEKAVARATVPGMPGISGYVDERGVVRYWIVAATSTILEEPRADAHHAVEQLAKSLTKGGVPTRLERDVATMNAATTISFFPLVAAIDAGGGVDGVLADKALLALALEAGKEAEALGKRIGKVAAWANVLTKFVGPYTLRPGVALARRVSPEAVRFVEAHFGSKLRAQHLAMGDAILDLARHLGAPMPSLEAFLVELRARPEAGGAPAVGGA